MPSQAPSTKKQLVAGICLLVIGLILLTGGVVGVGWRYHMFSGSESWPTTRGTVIASEKLQSDDGEGGVDWKVRIQYEYTIDGVRRTARTIALGFMSGQSGVTSDFEDGTLPLFGEEEPAAAVVARYPAGAVVDAYYHPQDPEIVCLERGDPEVSDLMMAFFAPLFFGVMAAMVGVLLIKVRY